MHITRSKYTARQTNKRIGKTFNLTMAHVNRHETMRYELDSKLTILNRTLQNIMVEISYF